MLFIVRLTQQYDVKLSYVQLLKQHFFLVSHRAYCTNLHLSELPTHIHTVIKTL